MSFLNKKMSKLEFYYLLFPIIIFWLFLVFIERKLLLGNLVLFFILLISWYFERAGFLPYIFLLIFGFEIILTFVVYGEELGKFFKKGFARSANYLKLSESIRDFLEFAREEKLKGILVFKRKDNLEAFIETGERIKTKVDPLVLAQIFGEDSPLRKGAVIIEGDEIVAVNAILPQRAPFYLSMLERKALALSQIVDALILVFEKEKISLFLEGEGVEVNPERVEAIFKTFNLSKKIKLS